MSRGSRGSPHHGATTSFAEVDSLEFGLLASKGERSRPWTAKVRRCLYICLAIASIAICLGVFSASPWPKRDDVNGALINANASVLKNACHDLKCYIDVKGYGCNEWGKPLNSSDVADCRFKAEEDFYSEDQIQNLLGSCPGRCRQCNESDTMAVWAFKARLRVLAHQYIRAITEGTVPVQGTHLCVNPDWWQNAKLELKSLDYEAPYDLIGIAVSPLQIETFKIVYNFLLDHLTGKHPNRADNRKSMEERFSMDERFRGVEKLLVDTHPTVCYVAALLLQEASQHLSGKYDKMCEHACVYDDHFATLLSYEKVRESDMGDRFAFRLEKVAWQVTTHCWNYHRAKRDYLLLTIGIAMLICISTLFLVIRYCMYISRRKRERKESSELLGISLDYILRDFSTEIQIRMSELEWRIDEDVDQAFTLASFIAKYKGSTATPPRQWKKACPCAPPIDPNFIQLAPVVAYGEIAWGYGKLCPRDGKPHCSMVDSDISSQRANIFMSWVWGYPVSVVINSLKSWVEREHEADKNFKTENSYLWWCFFCNNQFRLLQDQQKRPTDELARVFGERLRSIGKMLIVIDQLRASTYVQRIWCIFEIFIATQQDIHCSVALPELALQTCRRVQTCEELFEITEVHAEEALASMPEDEQGIKLMILERYGSFDLVNTTVAEALMLQVLRFLKAHRAGVSEPTFAAANSIRNSRHTLHRGSEIRARIEDALVEIELGAM